MMDFDVEDFHNEKSCLVCLEDFQAMSLVKRMPFCHIFHGNCIDNWLPMSHYCHEGWRIL
jgi:hypothetical protein